MTIVSKDLVEGMAVTLAVLVEIEVPSDHTWKQAERLVGEAVKAGLIKDPSCAWKRPQRSEQPE